MKVFVTGATGFTGSYVVPRLLAEGWSVKCLVRDAQRAQGLADAGIELAVGDLADATGLQWAMAGCDALLNIASMGFGHMPAVIEAAEKSRLGRCVFTSTTAIFTRLNASSKTVRTAAESTVRASRLEWVIVRPTMIFGSSRDRNMCRLVRYLGKFPVLPVFGTGTCRMQPVYVDDLAQALVAALSRPAAARREYNVAGSVPMTYNDLVRTTAQLMGRKVRLLHLPHRPMVRVLEFLERRHLKLPLKAEQILRLNEDKAFSWADAARDLGYRPLPFQEAMRRQLSEMKATA